MSFGDPAESFVEELEAKYHRKMFNHCMRFVGYDRRCIGVAQSCVQDVLLVAYQEYDKLKDHPNILGWLYLSCNHRMIDYAEDVRATWNLEASLEGLKERGIAVGEADSVQRWHKEEDSASTVGELKKELSGSDMDLLCAHHMEGRPLKDIAAERGTTEGSIKVMLHRARKKAQKILKGKMIDKKE